MLAILVLVTSLYLIRSWPPVGDYTKACQSARSATTTAAKTIAATAAAAKAIAAHCAVDQQAASAQCTGGDAEACVKAGHLAEMSADEAGALKLFVAGCLKGSAEGCYSEGRLSKDNAALQRERYQRACTMGSGSGQGCYAIGLLLSHSKDQKDVARAPDYLRRSCEVHRDGNGCHAWGRYLLYNGQAERGLSLLTEACLQQRKRGACAEAGYYLKEMKKDFLAAEPLLAQACRDGEASSCSRLGRLFEKEQLRSPEPLQRALWFYTKGCSLGDSETGCFNKNLIMRRLGGAQPTQRDSHL